MPETIFSHGRWSFDSSRRELHFDGRPVPLGKDAIDVLDALIRARGRPVAPHDLAALLPASETDGASRISAAIAVLLDALGDSRALLETDPSRGFRLAGDWFAGRDGVPERTRPAFAVPRLPLETGKLFGRQTLIQQVGELLRTHRVVTLAGPGGVGKSRLALAAAHRRVAETADPAWFVELAGLTDGRFVFATVADVLGLHFADGLISPSAIAKAIGRRSLLLVLDNCEHVLEATAELAETLGSACPELVILATSREALRGRDERVVIVPPLATPSEDAASFVLPDGAVDFFMHRIEALGAAAQAEGWDRSMVASVCRRLDGMPLAIEIAAACAATIGIDVVFARVTEGLDLPATGRRSRIPRQQTLRATFAWSYRLLSIDEQRLLRLLGIFADGFTFEAAAAVDGVSPGNAWSVLDGISSLVAKSLVHVEDTSQGRRWRLHETTRSYALEQLDAAGDTGHAMRRLTHFLIELLRHRPTAATLFGREIGNVRVALGWAFRPGGDAAAGVQLTALCVPFLLQRSLQRECREWAEQALEHLARDLGLDDAATVRAYVEVAVALVYTTELAESSGPLLSRVQAMATRHGDRNTQLRAIWANLVYCLNTGALDQAGCAVEAFRGAAVAGGDTADISVATTLRGTVQLQRGAFLDASRCFGDMLASYTPPKDGRHAALFIHDQELFARGALALALFLQGEFQRSHDLVAQCLVESGDVSGAHDRRHLLGRTVVPISLEAGDLAAAQMHLTALTELTDRQGVIYYRTIGQGLQGLLLCQTGDFSSALASLRLCVETCLKRRWMLMHPQFSSGIATCLAGLDRAEEAIETIDTAIVWSERTGNRWYLAELQRIRGEVLLPLDKTEARLCFASAVALAAAQGARLWQLRSAIRLARWHRAEGDHIAAHACLAPICASFPHDAVNAELQSARLLLADPAGRG